MFIQTENTPNPNALKFIPGTSVSQRGPIHFSSLEQAKSVSPIAAKLFLKGVDGVFLGSDFITITKSESIDWESLKTEILVIIMDHFVANSPIFFETQDPHKLDITDETLSDIEKQIIEIIETRVRPSVAMDGGDIIYKGFENGVVKLELHGACSGCPSSTITLKQGIESMLKHFVPEVDAVEAVNGEY